MDIKCYICFYIILNSLRIFLIIQVTNRIIIPIFIIILKLIFIFLWKIILIISVIIYKVEKNIVYNTIGLNRIDDKKSKFRREITALVPPHAGQ